MMPAGRSNSCENMNHCRRDAPVGYCPQCGGVVNAAVATGQCSDTKHAAARLQQSTFCVDCGKQLVMRR